MADGKHVITVVIAKKGGRLRCDSGLVFSLVTPQRRTALVSVVAAVLLVTVKLATGLATHSLGLVSEAVHSGTDLVRCRC